MFNVYECSIRVFLYLDCSIKEYIASCFGMSPQYVYTQQYAGI